MDVARTRSVVTSANIAVLLVLGTTHLLNDLIQSLIPAIYPIIQQSYNLSLAQIGLITLAFQLAGSLFQPLVGAYTDRNPLPYSTVGGMGFTLVGVTLLAFASSYAMILVSVVCIGIGSSIYHPEATRMARYASHAKQGLAQGIFQVGGQLGGALGPLLAAIIIVPRGQESLSWFASLAILAMALMIWIARQHSSIREQFFAASATAAKARKTVVELSRRQVWLGLIILAVLMFSKLAYLESFRSFYTFYAIQRFGVTIAQSQIMLFIMFISSAAGVLLGGMVGDKIGRYRVIWLSILGPLPFTLLLPYVDLYTTIALTVVINLIMASAFASIMIYAMELMPSRIGMIGGVFYGLNFGMAGVAAAGLGWLGDSTSLQTVYVICSFFPLVGLMTWFLPRIHEHKPR